MERSFYTKAQVIEMVSDEVGIRLSIERLRILENNGTLQPTRHGAKVLYSQTDVWQLMVVLLCEKNHLLKGDIVSLLEEASLTKQKQFCERIKEQRIAEISNDTKMMTDLLSSLADAAQTN